MALIFQNHPVLTFLCCAQCYPLRKGLLTRPPVTVNPLNHIFSAFFCWNGLNCAFNFFPWFFFSVFLLSCSHEHYLRGVKFCPFGLLLSAFILIPIDSSIEPATIKSDNLTGVAIVCSTLIKMERPNFTQVWNYSWIRRSDSRLWGRVELSCVPNCW